MTNWLTHFGKIIFKVLAPLFSLAIKLLSPLTKALAKSTKKLWKHKATRRFCRFTRKYSSQLSFAALIIAFLTVTVGEGQAYHVDAPKIAAQIGSASDGFLSKPQLYGSQTILTGEVQQEYAIIYKVEQGDSIVTIAKRYNLSAGTIIDANNLSGLQAEKIKAGDSLVIPANDTDTSTAWLDEINKEKAAAAAAAEKERLRQLAAQRQASSSRVTAITSSGYKIIGTMRGSYNGGMPGWCTWYVNYRRADLPNGMGNANTYLSRARAAGFATGTVPRVGAVIQTAESSYGHVGIVDGVGGGMVTITEMNYVGRYIVSQRTISASSSSIRGYIY